MGILKEPANFVRSLKLPAGFSVCELGDQMMSGGPVPTPAKAFYQSLGCGRYVSLDGNGRGTFTVDLNQPIPNSLIPLVESFDLVTDFGTGEHIFDQAQVWRTMHWLTKPGGYMVIDRPSQGYGKHCFYLITMGLVQDIAVANRYQIVTLTTAKTPRGKLVRAILRRPSHLAVFCVPQQGRYRPSLQLRKGAA